jgi:myo-inositol-1(or 4)-monophosphatase
LNGSTVAVSKCTTLAGARILASRSEVKRGEWERFSDAPFTTIPCGSVAYKLAQVSAGLADATFTLVPKNEWDVAAGALLVEAAGGRIVDKQGRPLSFNRKDTLFGGVIAAGQPLLDQIWQFLQSEGE